MTTRRPSEDLFEESRMTFGEHLEELRGALIRSLLGIAIGCAFGFFVAQHVVGFLQQPLFQALKKFNDNQANAEYKKRLGYFPPEIQTKMQQDDLAPTTVYIDPGQLITVIRTISPGSLAEIDLTPYQFNGTHVPLDNVPIISRWLIEPGSATEAQQPRLRELSQRLTTADRADLQIIANTATPSAAQQARLIEVLNTLIDRTEIHQSDAFAQWFQVPAWSIWQMFSKPEDNALADMKAQVDMEDKDFLSRRLNRLLVTKTFEGHINFPTIELSPIEIWQDTPVSTQALSPHESFLTWIKAAVVTGLVLSGPWVFIQIWSFVAAGLYPHEKKYVHYYLPISIVLFALGVGLAFFFVFEPVLNFLFTFNASMGINPQVRIGEWLSFVLFLPLGFGIAFQLPLVMLFMNRIGLFSVEAYISKWRLAVMIIAVLSMILTPADPISMILLGAPLTLLYFLGIGLCKWMPKPSNPFGEVAETA